MYIVSTDIYPQTDTLVHDENKETLAPLTPPPITHAASTPSSQLSQLQKLYKYTHTLSHIHTHPHTPFFLLTPFPDHHGSLQLVLVCPLAAAACTRCLCACARVCARLCVRVFMRVYTGDIIFYCSGSSWAQTCSTHLRSFSMRDRVDSESCFIMASSKLWNITAT